MGKIYCQGKLTTKKQAVCLELGPLCLISELPLPTQPPSPAGVIRCAFTGAVQSYLTFPIELLTFFLLDMCHNLYFGKTLLRNAKLVRVCQNYRKFKYKRCSKVMQVF